MSEPRLNTRTRTANWRDLVEEHENLNEPHPSYVFTGRTFTETDKDGVYRNVESS